MRLLIATATWIAQVCYAALKAVLPARRKVVMLSRQADTPSRDFRMLAEEISARVASVEIVTKCCRIGPSTNLRVAYLGEILTQMYHLATSRVCIVDGYIVPVSILTHRSELTVIQVWHALGAIKRFGYQSLDRPGGRSSKVAHAMRMHRNYDVVLCGGPASIDIFAEAFRADPVRVLPLGLPRVDYLLTQAACDAATTDKDTTGCSTPPRLALLRERFPALADSSHTRVLYAPTFRKDRPDHHRDVVERFSDERYTLIVKPHPLVDIGVSGSNVIDASGVDVLDLLPVSDVVITDYSAVAFEAAVLDKPLYFFVFDLDTYSVEHGLNIDLLAEMPHATSRDIEEIARWIDSGGYDHGSLRSFKSHYVPVTDGGCTRRIVELIFDRLGRPDASA
jgi:CDP-ribitol ribitolphosphotransferase